MDMEVLDKVPMEDLNMGMKWRVNMRKVRRLKELKNLINVLKRYSSMLYIKIPKFQGKNYQRC